MVRLSCQREFSRRRSRQRRLYDKITIFFSDYLESIHNISLPKKPRRGAHNRAGCATQLRTGKMTAVSITIDGLTGARQMLTVDGPSDPLSGGKSTWLNRA
jgi:hypothetical protein